MKNVKRALRARPWAELKGAEIITVKAPFISGFNWTNRHLLRRIVEIVCQRFFEPGSAERPYYPYESGAVVHLEQGDFVDIDTDETILSQLQDVPLLKNCRPYFGIVVVVPIPPTRRVVYREFTWGGPLADVYGYPSQRIPFHPSASQMPEIYQPRVYNFGDFMTYR